VRILVGRTAADAPAWADVIRAAGHEPLLVPLIAREPVPDALAGITGPYDWLVVTSAAAAERVPPQLQASCRKIAAVGAATAAKLTRADRVGTAGAQELVNGLGDLKGMKILFPRADGAKATSAMLRTAGGVVDDPVVYRTVTAPGLAAALAAIAPIDVALLTSPSAVTALVEAGVRPLCVAIGMTTAREARRHQLDVTLAVEPTVEAMLEAIPT
jgi:uroporphyrinogen-III synthase